MTARTPPHPGAVKASIVLALTLPVASTIPIVHAVAPPVVGAEDLRTVSARDQSGTTGRLRVRVNHKSKFYNYVVTGPGAPLRWKSIYGGQFD